MDPTAAGSLASGESMHCPCIQLFRIVYLVLLVFCLVNDDALDTNGFDFQADKVHEATRSPKHLLLAEC